MPTLHDTELTDPVRSAMVRWLEEADPRHLLEATRRLRPRALDGVRPQPRNAPTVVRRLAAPLRREGELPQWLVHLLREVSPVTPPLRALSVAAIAAALPLLAAWWGRAPLAAALLLEEREEAWDLARRLLELDEPSLPDRETARQQLAELFGPLVAEVHRWDPSLPPGPPEKEEPRDEGDEARRIAHLERQLTDRERRLQRLQERLEAERREAGEELARAREAAEEHRRRATGLKREVESLRRELAAARAGRERAVAEAVRRELAGLCHTWLAAPMATEREVAAGADRAADLLERGEDLLRRQAERDRHYGNRHILRQRRARLLDLRDRLREAQAEALAPDPGLPDLLAEVERELSRLAGLLGEGADPAPVSFLESRLAAALRAADTPEELNRLGERLAELEAEDLLEVAVVRRLRAREHAAWTRLYDRHAPRGGRRLSPAGRLQRALRRRTPLVLLVDGHNVLLTAEDIFPGAALSPEREREGRERLVAEMASLAARLPKGSDVRLVFDGPHRREEHPVPGLTVGYSGGEGRHRADTVLLEYVSFLARQGSRAPVFLVTDDRDLAEQARELKATVLPVGLLLGLLQALPPDAAPDGGVAPDRSGDPPS